MVRDALQFPGVLLHGELDSHRAHRQLLVCVLAEFAGALAESLNRLRLAGLIPAPALRRANDAMQEQGLAIDLTQIKPENLEELVEHLNDLTVDVDQKDANTKVKVRVYCE